jgi:hypothetical protein
MEQDKAKVRSYAPRALPSRACCSLTLPSCGSQTPAKGSGRSPSPLWLTLTDRHRLRFAEHQGRHQRSTRLRPAFAHYTLLDRAYESLQRQALARRRSASFLPGSTWLETRVQIVDIMKPIPGRFRDHSTSQLRGRYRHCSNNAKRGPTGFQIRGTNKIMFSRYKHYLRNPELSRENPPNSPSNTNENV